MEQANPNVDALTEYQKAFNEVAKGMNENAKNGAEQLIKKFCPDAASLYKDFQARYRSQVNARTGPLPPPPQGPDVPTFDPINGRRLKTYSPPPPQPPPLPPQGPSVPTFDRYGGLPSTQTAPVSQCPPGQFWDGRQCRGSVSTSYGGMMPYASMTGSAPSLERMFRPAGVMGRAVQQRFAKL
jgi:hypothetical protein